MTSFRWPRWRNCSPEPARIGKLTREQLSEMIEQRQRMTAALTPEQVGELQRQRAEQVSRLTPGQLAEPHQQRQQLLPDGFRPAGLGRRPGQTLVPARSAVTT